MKLISEEIENIKNKHDIENNIIIGKEVDTKVFFNEIKKINDDILLRKALIIYISKQKLANIEFPELRTITNIYGENVNNKKIINNKIKKVLIMKDCYFNQRTNEFKKCLNLPNIRPSSQYINILIIGPSRVGKSSFCNVLLNKLEAIESMEKESVTTSFNDYSNNIFHLFDTPGLTITKNKSLGDTTKLIKNSLNKIFSKVDDSKDDIHLIFYILKYDSNDENSIPILKYLDEQNKKRDKIKLHKIPIIFLFNETKNNNGQNNRFPEGVKSIKKILSKNEILSLYMEDYDDNQKVEDEDKNIIRIDIKGDEDAKQRLYSKIIKYLSKNNPLSDGLFQKIKTIKENFDRVKKLREEKKKLNEKEKNEIKEYKKQCQDTILKINKENHFYNKIFSLENIIDSCEAKTKWVIAFFCVSTFFSGFIPFPFVDIPAVYAQQALMILFIALSYGFSIDEIPIKATIGAAFGVSVGLAGLELRLLVILEFKKDPRDI